MVILKNKRINIYISETAIAILNGMEKKAKKLYHNGVNRSRIIEDLVLRADPIIDLKHQAKKLQVDLQATVEKIRHLEDENQKKNR